MSFLIDLLNSAYPRDLVVGMVVNFQIAALALLVGLALGIPLVLLQRIGKGWDRVVAPLIGLMRAAPTFVVMFFLLNIIPRQFQLQGVDLSLPGTWIVALSLAPFAAAYITDNGRTAIDGLRAGSRTEALLFLPNLLRAYIVLVMSSSAGVAIGVSEGVAVVLRETDRYNALGQQLMVFAVGILAFGVVFQAGFALVRGLMRLLSIGKPEKAAN